MKSKKEIRERIDWLDLHIQTERSDTTIKALEWVLEDEVK